MVEIFQARMYDHSRVLATYRDDLELLTQGPFWLGQSVQ
jgi:hypothetical protein